MARKKEWHINIDGKEYSVLLERTMWSGLQKLYINGVLQDLKIITFQTLRGLDLPLEIGGKECRLIIVGRKADIVVDEVFLDSGKVYIPFKKLPLWTWIFILASIAIPIVNQGGLVPVIIGAYGAIFCMRIGISPYMKTSNKFFASIGVVLLAWLVFILFAFAIIILAM